jgi:hypothetical protein
MKFELNGENVSLEFIELTNSIHINIQVDDYEETIYISEDDADKIYEWLSCHVSEGAP